MRLCSGALRHALADALHARRGRTKVLRRSRGVQPRVDTAAGGASYGAKPISDLGPVERGFLPRQRVITGMRALRKVTAL